MSQAGVVTRLPRMCSASDDAMGDRPLDAWLRGFHEEQVILHMMHVLGGGNELRQEDGAEHGQEELRVHGHSVL